MKLRTLSTDTKCIAYILRAFTATASFRPKLAVIFHLDENGIRLMVDPCIDRNGSLSSCCELSRSTFFPDYNFRGVNDAHNAIMFSVPSETLHNVVKSISTTNIASMKLKLTKGGGQNFILNFNLEHKTVNNRKRNVKHNVIISVIHIRDWPSHQPQALNYQISLLLPKDEKIVSAISRLNTITKYVVITGKYEQLGDSEMDKKGFITMNFTTDTLTMKSKFGRLELNHQMAIDNDEAQDKFQVRLNASSLQKLMNAFSHLNPDSMACSISQDCGVCFHFYNPLAIFQVNLPHYEI